MIVIIPHYSNYIDLSVLLVQLQSQTVLPKKIYIADNSRNHSARLVAMRYQFSVEIAMQDAVGNIYKSWNSGMEYAGKEDVVILNDDVLIPKNFVEIMKSYMSTDIGSIYCPVNAGFPPVKSVRKGYSWENFNTISFKTLSVEQYVLPPSLSGWCMGIPKKTRDAIGLFDEKFSLYFGDKDYEKRIFQSNGNICFIQGLFVQHYGSSSTRTIQEDDHKMLYERDEEMYKKKWSIV